MSLVASKLIASEMASLLRERLTFLATAYRLGPCGLGPCDLLDLACCVRLPLVSLSEKLGLLREMSFARLSELEGYNRTLPAGVVRELDRYCCVSLATRVRG